MELKIQLGIPFPAKKSIEIFAQTRIQLSEFFGGYFIFKYHFERKRLIRFFFAQGDMLPDSPTVHLTASTHPPPPPPPNRFVASTVVRFNIDIQLSANLTLFLYGRGEYLKKLWITRRGEGKNSESGERVSTINLPINATSPPYPIKTNK